MAPSDKRVTAQIPDAYQWALVPTQTGSASDVKRDHSEEMVAHLVGLVGAKVVVSLEISAEIPEGVPENVVRTATENARVLKFVAHGFETE